MAGHAVRGIVSFPFEVDVDTDSPDTFSLNDLFAAVGARDSVHFGLMVLDETSDIFYDDLGGEASITSIAAGTIWVDDGLPSVGVSDGKGGVIWQER